MRGTTHDSPICAEESHPLPKQNPITSSAIPHLFATWYNYDFAQLTARRLSSWARAVWADGRGQPFQPQPNSAMSEPLGPLVPNEAVPHADPMARSRRDLLPTSPEPARESLMIVNLPKRHAALPMPRAGHHSTNNILPKTIQTSDPGLSN